MPLTLFLNRFSKAAFAATVFSTGLVPGLNLGAPAQASVLVKPAVLQEGPTAIEQPEASSTAATQNIVDLAGSTAEFSTLTSALLTANLTDFLDGDGPFTVFAPTDAAFSALPPGALDTLLRPENQDLLVGLLYNHMAYGDVTSNQLASGALDTLQDRVSIGVTPTGITVDGANVVQADVAATNGVIHAVDKVLLPDGFDSQLQARIDGNLPEGNLPTETAETTPNAGTSITRTTTLQETAIDRVAPVAPAADSSAVTDRPQSSPVVDTEPSTEASEEADAVRALW
ncbi:MAG: fasciclin domain-containing protein [Cyanobacteria bacterium J06634_5]